jgi:hypothetical protein
MAEVTEIGGVIIPSASNAAPPMIAGITSHFLLLRTSAYKENIPPSPLLSACSVRITYLTVVWRVSVQIMHDNAPMISSSEMTFPLVIALRTYKGDVPISPKIIPKAMSIPAALARLCEICILVLFTYE